MVVDDLGILDYELAWQKQEEIHAQVLEGAEERILLVEHPPVITLGRRPDVSRNLIANKELLNQLGVKLVQSDRGGDITFHGLGQLVAYPIIRLADHKLSVSGYVHTLEKAIIETLRKFGMEGFTDSKAVGVWVNQVGSAQWAVGSKDDSLRTAHCALPTASKIAAIGVRVRKGVTLHGLALNVSTDLRYFNLIVPCGINDRGVTSLSDLLEEGIPTMASVKEQLARSLITAIN